MRILILNWKDIRHPQHGGAEILTHEMAKRFVKKGHSVTLFTTSFPLGKELEIIDGVVIIRAKHIGIPLPYNPTHFLRSFLFYKQHMQGKVDIVIDELHGIPFFTPLYVKEKIFFLVCEVAQNIWDTMFPFPFNALGRMVERIYFSLYKQVQTLTISPSTKKDLLQVGIPEKNITILPMGIERVSISLQKKEQDPTFIFVGRMNKMKGVEDAIKAFSLYVKKFPTSKLWLVGSGEEKYVDYLRKLIIRLNIDKSASFFGYISESEKYKLLARAHAILVPSVREGFGLIVPEANSVGTPAIVYDSAGLRDTVKTGLNGIIVRENSPYGLFLAMQELLKVEKKYQQMVSIAKKESKNYNWDNTAEDALNFI